MKAIQITRASPTADELWELYRKEKDGRMKERLHVIALMHRVKSAPKVAEIVGRVRNTVWEWVKAFNEGGLEGLTRKSPPGKKSRLSDDEKELLKADICRNPRDLGYDFSNWDGKSVAFHIKKRFGKEYAPRTTIRLMHKLGFTLQRPSTVPAKADPKAKEEFKKDLKKRWRPSGTTS